MVCEEKTHGRYNEHLGNLILFDPFARVDGVEFLHDDHWHAPRVGKV